MSHAHVELFRGTYAEFGGNYFLYCVQREIQNRFSEVVPERVLPRRELMKAAVAVAFSKSVVAFSKAVVAFPRLKTAWNSAHNCEEWPNTFVLKWVGCSSHRNRVGTVTA